MKLIRHSINLIIIANLIICYLTQMHLAVKSGSPFNNLHRFIQKATTKTETIIQKYSSGDKLTSKAKIFYDVDIFTIKGNDPIGYKYDPYTSKIALNKNIEFYQEGKVVRELPYNTYMFLDGVLVFDDLSFFLKVKTADYMDIMNKFRPRIEKFAFSYDNDKFNKYCFFMINHTWILKEEKDKGKEFSLMIFCFNPETTQKEMLERFPEDFRLKYTKAIVDSEDFLSLQKYRLKQNIQVQFYDPHITLEDIQKQSHATSQPSATGGLPTLYTSFSNEGLIMNLDPNHDPTKVRYSFRYDQVIKCRGEHPHELKKYIKPEITSLFRPDECCVSYVVDFNNTCSMAMFCSTYLNDWKCRADIKIFRSTLYKRCLIDKTENIIKKVDRITKDIKGEKETFLNKAAIIYALRETMNKNMMDSLDANSTFGKILANMGTKNKTYEAAILATLRPDCESVYRRIEAKEKVKRKKKERGPEMGLDLGSKVEEELKYSPGILSAVKIEELQKELCEDYRKLEELEKNNQDANKSNLNLNNNGENGSNKSGYSLNDSSNNNPNSNETQIQNSDNLNLMANQNQGQNPSSFGESENANGKQPSGKPDFINNGNISNPILNELKDNLNKANPSLNSNHNPDNSYSPPSKMNKSKGLDPSGNSNSPLNQRGGDPINSRSRNGLNPYFNKNRNSGFNNPNSKDINGNPINSNDAFDKKNPLHNETGNNNNSSLGSLDNPNRNNNSRNPDSGTNSINNGNLNPNYNNNASFNHKPVNDLDRNLNPIGNDKKIDDKVAEFNSPNQADAGRGNNLLDKGLGKGAKGSSRNFADNPSVGNHNNSNSPLLDGNNYDNKSVSNDKDNKNPNYNPHLNNPDNSNNSERAHDPRNENHKNGNTNHSPIDGYNNNASTNFNSEKPSLNNKDEFTKNMDTIKKDLLKENLDPKYFEKMALLINKYPDIKNTLMKNPKAVTQFKPEDLMKIGESTPEDSVRLLRQMTEDNKKLFLLKKDQVENKISICPTKKGKNSNNVKGNKENHSSSDANNGNKEDNESINSLVKDNIGKPLKPDDKNDGNTVLPKDIDTQYTDDQENKLFDIRPEIDGDQSKKIDNTIKIPVFDESKQKNKPKESGIDEYKNPIEEDSKENLSAKGEDILNFDSAEKIKNNNKKSGIDVEENNHKKSEEDQTNDKSKETNSSGISEKDGNINNKNENDKSQEKSGPKKNAKNIKNSSKKSLNKNVKGRGKTKDSQNKENDHDNIPREENSQKNLSQNSTSSDTENSNKQVSVPKKNDISKEESEKFSNGASGRNIADDKSSKSSRNDSNLEKPNINKKSDNELKPGESTNFNVDSKGINAGNIEKSNDTISMSDNSKGMINGKNNQSKGNKKNSSPRQNNNLKNGKTNKDIKPDEGSKNIENSMENGGVNVNSNGNQRSPNSNNKGVNNNPMPNNPNGIDNNKNVSNLKNIPNKTDTFKNQGNNNATKDSKQKVPVFSVTVSQQNQNQKPSKKGLIEKNFLSAADGSSYKVMEIVDSINLE